MVAIFRSCSASRNFSFVPVKDDFFSLNVRFVEQIFEEHLIWEFKIQGMLTTFCRSGLAWPNIEHCCILTENQLKETSIDC